MKDNETEKLTCTVIKDWTASYPDPIQVSAGEPLELDGQKDVWDGYTWLWAKSLNGKEGWVPDCILNTEGPITVKENYTAMELTCKKGQILTAEKKLHGWVFCKNEDGLSGWVPERNLSKINMTQVQNNV